MIINHKKLNQTPKKNYEIVLHAMHCGGGHGGLGRGQIVNCKIYILRKQGACLCTYGAAILPCMDKP